MNWFYELTGCGFEPFGCFAVLGALLPGWFCCWETRCRGFLSAAPLTLRIDLWLFFAFWCTAAVPVELLEFFR